VERSDLTGAVLDGRYRVLGPVAEGAMGVVYRAERLKLGRIVAVKVLHDVLPGELSARKRFEIEAMAMAKLEHPHCASVLDVGVHDDQPYVVMEFVSGQNLKELIEHGAQPIPRAVELVRQVLSGLAHAHEHGIIHRDIKPANIVLSHKTGLGDHAKILDFGLARFHDTGQNLTTGIVVGTPAYMAPEQIRGIALDHRIDLYACGVLLFELLTGEKPFHSLADDPIEVCKMHLMSPVPRLSDKRPGDYGELEAVSAQALAKLADERFATAQDFAAALDAAVPRRPSLPGIAPTPVPRRPSLPGVAPTPVPVPVPMRAPVASAAPASAEPVQLASADVVALDASWGSAVAGPSPAAGPSLAAGPALAAGPPPAAGPEPDEPVSRPGTFLGIAMTPPSGRRAASVIGPPPSAAAVAPLEAAAAKPAPASPASLEAAASARAPASPASPASLEAASPAPASLEAAPSRPAKPAGVATAPSRSRQRWLIGAIAAVAIAGLAVVLSLGRGGSASSVAGVPGGAEIATGSAALPDPSRELIARADDLVAQGDKDAALDLLNRARRQSPDNAALAYATGKIYFSKYYWTEGLRNFRDVLRSDPAYRTDPELIKIVLRGFLITPSYNDDLASFLRDDIGAAAQPLLEETARDHPSAATRSRAASELRRYR
jgi:serine/threonine-protein kinase